MRLCTGPVSGQATVDDSCNHRASIVWVFCRIDYHLATKGVSEKALNASIYKDEKFSDHAPLTIECDWSI